jgi:hypothetical protein
VPPPQPPSSGRRQQPQQFFAPTARSSTSGFQHLAANPPWQLAHLATPVGPLGRCPRLSAPPGPRAGATGRAGSGQRHGGELPSVPLCPARTSPRSAGLVIDTVVCHLPKWETGSGRFGGCLIKTRSPNSADRGQAFKRLAHYLMICIKSDLVPRVWRACHYSAISLIRPFFCALLT